MIPADRIAAEANARVNGWPTLSHAERQSLLSELPAYIRELRAGGAILAERRGSLAALEASRRGGAVRVHRVLKRSGARL
jgi:hypothetical protein